MKYLRLFVVAFVLSFALLRLADAQTISRSATITWLPVLKNSLGESFDETTTVTYKIYMGPKGSLLSAKTVAGENIAALSYTINNLPLGTTCFQLTAVAKSGTLIRESDPSAEGCKTFNFHKPAVVLGVTVS